MRTAPSRCNGHRTPGGSVPAPPVGVRSRPGREPTAGTLSVGQVGVGRGLGRYGGGSLRTVRGQADGEAADSTDDRADQPDCTQPGCSAVHPYRHMEQRVLAAVVASGFPITLTQARLFPTSRPGGSRRTTLAAAAQVSKQTATFLVDQLVTAGLRRAGPRPRGRTRPSRRRSSGSGADTSAYRAPRTCEDLAAAAGDRRSICVTASVLMAGGIGRTDAGGRERPAAHASRCVDTRHRTTPAAVPASRASWRSRHRVRVERNLADFGS